MPDDNRNYAMARRALAVRWSFRANSYLLDGANMRGYAGTATVSAAESTLGVETVQEFRVVTNAFSADYGRGAGGVISLVSKNGTNDVHGAAFEFFRDSSMDARNFFDRGDQPPPFPAATWAAGARSSFVWKCSICSIVPTSRHPTTSSSRLPPKARRPCRRPVGSRGRLPRQGSCSLASRRSSDGRLGSHQPAGT